MEKFQLSIFLIISQITFGQTKLCRTDILNGIEIKQINLIDNLNQLDFSKLWLETDNEVIFGIIGKEHQRLLIKFLTIEKNVKKHNEYIVYGKYKVKENVCDFGGKITLTNILEISSENYGVDDEYKESQIRLQGLLTAKYEFFENKNQNHSGYFTGITKTLFYIDKNEIVKYNDIGIESDGYSTILLLESGKCITQI